MKQRLIGAAVLVALAVIFLPMLVKGPAPDSGVSDLSMRVPDEPGGEYRTIDLPLVVPADAPAGGVLGAPEPLDDDRLATVDTATAPPPAPAGVDDGDEGAGGGDRGDARHEDAADPVAAPEPRAPEPAPPAPAPVTTPAPAPAVAPASVPGPATASRLPATTAGGDYVVHFGAFASERDAQLIVRQLGESGLAAYSEPFTLNGRPAQRVRLGPYASREAAETVRARAAQVRADVTPRVVALDAPAATAAAGRPATATPAPAADASRPAPATAAADVGFAVQLGAFGNAAEATRLRDRLRALGVTAFTDTVDTDKGRLTRVKAGPVPTRADAERLRAEVKARAGLDGMIRSHP